MRPFDSSFLLLIVRVLLLVLFPLAFLFDFGASVCFSSDWLLKGFALSLWLGGVGFESWCFGFFSSVSMVEDFSPLRGVESGGVVFIIGDNGFGFSSTGLTAMISREEGEPCFLAFNLLSASMIAIF